MLQRCPRGDQHINAVAQQAPFLMLAESRVLNGPQYRTEATAENVPIRFRSLPCPKHTCPSHSFMDLRFLELLAWR